MVHRRAYWRFLRIRGGMARNGTSRDQYGQRVYGLGDHRRSRFGGFWYAIAIILVVIALGLIVGYRQVQRNRERHYGKVITTTYTEDGTAIRWYVMNDPYNKVQYLYNDDGCCVPRIDADGTIMGTETPAEPDESTAEYD